MRLEQGWLDKANRRPSPNYDDRSNEEIDLIVIHSISLPPGIFGNSFVEDFFQNKLDYSKDKYFQEIKDLKVSSHFLIKRDGEITQFVSILKRAWHAGVSSFEGREDCNDYSIGIELEGTDKSNFTDTQYERLNEVIISLKDYYPEIVDENIIGHNEVSPDRKNDPGPFFEWNRIKV